MTQNETGKKDLSLTPQQTKVIASLLSGDRQADAATSAGVSRSTLARWLQDPVFERELENATSELGVVLFRRISKYSEAALSVTAQLLLTDESPPSVRLGAARLLLDGYTRLRELHVIETKMARIEKLLTPEPVDEDEQDYEGEGAYDIEQI